MARVTLLSAMAFDEARYRETGIADPAIVVRGELPAHALPFLIARTYRGPQGTYEEALLLLDPDEVVVYARPYHLIQLRGEMFADRFVTRVDGADEDVEISSPGEHQLVLLIDDEEVGRVPVFIDAPESAVAAGVLDEVVSAALAKGALVWVEIPQPSGTAVRRPAWYVYDAGQVYLLTGPGEQQLDGIDRASQVRLHVKSKDLKATVATLDADVRVVPNDSEEFTRIATLGMGKRLNLPDGEGALERWRTTATLVALTPRV